MSTKNYIRGMIEIPLNSGLREIFLKLKRETASQAGYRAEVKDIKFLTSSGYFEDDNNEYKLKQVRRENMNNRRWNKALDFLEEAGIRFEVVNRSHFIIRSSGNNPILIYPKGGKYRFKGSGITKYNYQKIESLLKKFNIIDIDRIFKEDPADIRLREWKALLEKKDVRYNMVNEYKIEAEIEGDIIEIYTKCSSWKSRLCEFNTYDKMEEVFELQKEAALKKETTPYSKLKKKMIGTGDRMVSIGGEILSIECKDGETEVFRLTVNKNNSISGKCRMKIYSSLKFSRDVIYLNLEKGTVIVDFEKILEKSFLDYENNINLKEVILSTL